MQNMDSQDNDTYLGVVAILDMLGTKGVWKDDAKGFLDKVTALYKRFTGLVELMRTEFNSKSKYYDLSAENFGVDFLTFSDTIIVSFSSKLIQMSDEDVRKRLQAHLLFSGVLLIGLMHAAIQSKIYFRGSLSLGKIYKKKDILIGPAIDEAACDYDQSNWIGISLTPHAASLINSLTESSLSGILNDFFIPFDLSKKTGYEKSCYVLNWGQFYFEKVVPKAIDIIKENLNFHFDKYNNASVYLKYKNTVEYYTKAVKNGRFKMVDYLNSKFPS